MGAQTEAASMGPRWHDRGNHHFSRPDSPRHGGLQWGRGGTTAETGAAARSEDEMARLQWGRGGTTAETRRAPRPSGSSCSPLQWGRGGTTAETTLAIPIVASDYGASMGPRWHDRGNRVSAETRDPPLALQWGRGGTTAETLRLRGLPRLPLLASMGPRWHDRGSRSHSGSETRPRCRFNGAAVARPRKPPVVAPSRWPEERLQWGRGGTTAETCPHRSSQAGPSPSLQWGRGGTTAETHEQRVRSDECLLASMGPRWHDRGNRVAWTLDGKVGSELQWGRGGTTAETAGSEVQRSDYIPASMGPRWHDRGNRYAT